MSAIPPYRLAHGVCEGKQALARATRKQLQAWHRLRRRCSVRGQILLSNGVLQIGFERSNGRNSEAYVGRDGKRLGTEHTYQR